MGTEDGLFGGRYALGDVLGAGGSGVVHRAHDTVLDRPVAIKLLKAGADDAVLRARLRAEAQLAGQLQHPGIAQIFDFGEADRGGPTPYIVMQYVEGTSLSQVLRERRALPVVEVMDLVAQIADALQVAHTAGIVHRDLKPSNVLVTPDGRAVLVDFGIARSHDTEPLTHTGSIVGTADYVSPEQCAGQSASTLSDIYSLGMLAYECLTGHRPFHRETPIATALAHLSDEAAPLTDAPAGVANLVAQMIRKEPAERPATAAEVASRAFVLSGERVPGETQQILPLPTAPPSSATTRVPARRVPRWHSRRARFGAVALALFLAMSGFVAARSSPPATVPDVEGMSWSQARAKLSGVDVQVEREPVDAAGIKRGEVLGQSPAPGTRVRDRTVVTLEVASGRVVLDPDRVAGKTYEKAAAIVVSLGLIPAREEVERPGADGTVVTALPAGRLKLGSMVTLTVGVQPGPAEVDSAPEPVTGGQTGGQTTTAPGNGGAGTVKDKSGKAKGNGKGNGNGNGKAKGHKK